MIHSLDVTVALAAPPVAPGGCDAHGVLEQLAAADGTSFGVDLPAARLDADDVDWSRGSGRQVARRRAGWRPPGRADLAGRSAPFSRGGPAARSAGPVVEVHP